MYKTAEKLARAMRDAMVYHDKYACRPGKRFLGAIPGVLRDIPFGVHPLQASMTILQEEALPRKIRWHGAFALCYHDVLEDTRHKLPKYLPKYIRKSVEAMTFDSFEDEAVRLWKKSRLIRLFKLYDKVSGLSSEKWMSPERKALHRAHVIRLADDVEKNFGLLNIVKIARVLCQEEN